MLKLMCEVNNVSQITVVYICVGAHMIRFKKLLCQVAEDKIFLNACKCHLGNNYLKLEHSSDTLSHGIYIYAWYV